MSTTKITVTVDNDVLAHARAAVDAGRTTSVSAYVTQAVRERATREHDVEAMTDRWGPFPDHAADWAKHVLGIRTEKQGTQRQAS